MKLCPICNKPFEPNNNRQKYCSRECWSKTYYYKPKKLKKSEPWHYCNRKDCLYYNDYKNPVNHCDYNWLTGKLRGCGKGDECNKYRHSTPEERKKFRNSVLWKDEEGRNKPIF